MFIRGAILLVVKSSLSLEEEEELSGRLACSQYIDADYRYTDYNFLYCKVPL